MAKMLAKINALEIENSAASRGVSEAQRAPLRGSASQQRRAASVRHRKYSFLRAVSMARADANGCGALAVAGIEILRHRKYYYPSRI